MLTCAWSADSGWAAPEIKPYGPLSLMPTASVLHYATECFEGMKAYRGHDGKLRLFRPERNCARMLRSATRIALPGFEPSQLQKLIEKLVGVDGGRWLPDDGPRCKGRGQFLYLRPTMIATTDALGVQIPREALLFIIMVLFPPLDEPDLAPKPSAVHKSLASAANGEKKDPAKTNTPNGMRLLASRHDMIRAWPGGFGNAKVGANYGPSLVAQQEARDRGYSQILWLFREECYVTEAGASNFFVIWRTKEEGRLQLITAPLGDGVILDGVTRQSVLEITKEKFEKTGEIEVVERRFTMREVVDAHEEGRLVEAFGSGTAFFIAPVSAIHFRGKDIELPLASGREAKYAMSIKESLRDIMFGNVPHPWGVVVREEVS